MGPARLADAFGWFTPGEPERLPIGDLVRRVLAAERESGATAGYSASSAAASSA